jgi:hypothetical protein
VALDAVVAVSVWLWLVPHGRHDSLDAIKLGLVEVRAFGTGVVLLRYQSANEP